jgi:protein disulfide-isomerase A1
MTNITNLDKWVENKNYTMVFFTRDDCNHCKRLDEELEKASEMINIGSPGSIPIPVARIKNYELNRYPILRIYVKGLFTEHSGEWESKKLE